MATLRTQTHHLHLAGTLGLLFQFALFALFGFAGFALLFSFLSCLALQLLVDGLVYLVAGLAGDY